MSSPPSPSPTLSPMQEDAVQDEDVNTGAILDDDGAGGDDIAQQNSKSDDVVQDETESTMPADESASGDDTMPVAPASPPRSEQHQPVSRSTKDALRSAAHGVASLPGAVMEYFHDDNENDINTDKNNNNSNAVTQPDQPFQPAMTESASRLASISDLDAIAPVPSPQRRARANRSMNEVKAAARRTGSAAVLPGVVHETNPRASPAAASNSEHRSMADIKDSFRKGSVHNADDASTVAPPMPGRSMTTSSMEEADARAKANARRTTSASVVAPGAVQQLDEPAPYAPTFSAAMSSSARSDNGSMPEIKAGAAVSASGAALRGSLDDRIRRKEAREARRSNRSDHTRNSNSSVSSDPASDVKDEYNPVVRRSITGAVQMDHSPDDKKKKEGGDDGSPKSDEDKLTKMKLENQAQEDRENLRRSKEMGVIDEYDDDDDDFIFKSIDNRHHGDTMVVARAHGASPTLMPVPVKDDPFVGASEEFSQFVKEDKEDKELGKFAKVGNENLAVAVAIDEENEEEMEYIEDGKYVVAAVEYDPNSKPPIHKNRRFRLYAMLLCCVLIVAIVIGIVAGVTDTSSTTTFADSSVSLETQYRNEFAKVVGDQVFEDGTPHDMAANWIIEDDPLSLPLNAPNLIQRYAMAFLYYYFSAGGTQPWRSCNPPTEGETDECVHQTLTFVGDSLGVVDTPGRTRWLTGTNECEWVGANCAGSETVVGLEIGGQDIEGTLPTELLALSYLQVLQMFHNKLTGTIPSEYSQLEHLIEIALNYNELTGTFPEELYTEGTGRLITIITGGNLLSGSISTMIGLLTGLRGIHVFDNMLTGKIPTEVGMLQDLVYTRWQNNTFTGTIPPELFSSEYLVELWVHKNELTGTIPSEVGLATDLTTLLMFDNKLTGSIPDELYNLQQLEFLNLSDNLLTGTISSRIGQLVNLDQFIVNDNNLTGTLPSEIGSLTSLSALAVYRTQFTGSVPCTDAFVEGNGQTHFAQADCLGGTTTPPHECTCCGTCCNRETGQCSLV